jgi:hypothetical protein
LSWAQKKKAADEAAFFICDPPSPPDVGYVGQVLRFAICG